MPLSGRRVYGDGDEEASRMGSEMGRHECALMFFVLGHRPGELAFFLPVSRLSKEKMADITALFYFKVRKAY